MYHWPECKVDREKVLQVSIHGRAVKSRPSDAGSEGTDDNDINRISNGTEKIWLFLFCLEIFVHQISSTSVPRFLFYIFSDLIRKKTLKPYVS